MDQQELPSGPLLNACPSAAETSAATGSGPSPPQQPPPPLPAQTTALAAMAGLKTEPIHEEEAEEELDEDEHEMEGIQSAGPGSPQPMCTNAGEENEADCGGGHPHLVMPPPSLSFHHHLQQQQQQQQQQQHQATPTAEIKTELPWNAGDCGQLKAEPSGCIRPSPPLLTSVGGTAIPAAVVSSANTTATAGTTTTPSSAANGGSTPSAVARPTFGEAFTGHTPLASPLTSRHPIRLPLSAVSGKTLFLLLVLSCCCCIRLRLMLL
jgi:hypothetical protein